MIFEQQLSAVDPVRLAEISGATKIRRFAAPLPPVVRPFLLTHQLRGCSCEDGGMAVPPDYGRLRGLGQYFFADSGLGFTPPEPIDSGTFDIMNLQVPSVGSGNASVLQELALAANFVPGVGQIASAAIQTFTTMLSQMESWFGIGAGRREADIIVPVQNQMMDALGIITQQILTSQSPSVEQLILYYREVWVRAVAFQEFVLQKNFTDRRASGQALNTVMPYLDGSCGYSEPVGMTATPTQFHCISWGDGTVGGVGTNGMLGAIGRAILAQDGSLPMLPDLHQAANQGIPVTNPGTIPGGGIPGITPGYTPPGTTIMGVSTPLALMIGVVGLFLFSRKSGIF